LGCRQHLPLGPEALVQLGVGQSVSHHLQGDRLPVVIDARGPIDVAHAAAGDVLLDLVGADAPPNQPIRAAGERQMRFHVQGARLGQEPLVQGPCAVAEEVGRLLCQGSVFGTHPIEMPLAFAGRTLPEPLAQVVNLPPTFGSHLTALP